MVLRDRRCTSRPGWSVPNGKVRAPSDAHVLIVVCVLKACAAFTLPKRPASCFAARHGLQGLARNALRFTAAANATAAARNLHAHYAAFGFVEELPAALEVLACVHPTAFQGLSLP